MGVLDPSGPAGVVFGSFETIDFIDFLPTSIFSGPSWPRIILFKNSVVTTPKGVAPGGEVDVGDGEIRVVLEDFYPCAERIGC